MIACNSSWHCLRNKATSNTSLFGISVSECVVSLSAAPDSEWLAVNASLPAILKHFEIEISISIPQSAWQSSPPGNSFCCGYAGSHVIKSLSAVWSTAPSSKQNKNMCWDPCLPVEVKKESLRDQFELETNGKYVCGQEDACVELRLVDESHLHWLPCVVIYVYTSGSGLFDHLCAYAWMYVSARPPICAPISRLGLRAYRLSGLSEQGE